MRCIVTCCKLWPFGSAAQTTLFDPMREVLLKPRPISVVSRSIVGFTATNRMIAMQDYKQGQILAVEPFLTNKRRIRLIYHIGPDSFAFSIGTALEDATFVLRSMKARGKIAVIADIYWIRIAVNIIRFAMPVKIKVFSNQQLAAAKVWINT